MKTAGKVLGIVGGALGIIISLVYVLIFILMANTFSNIQNPGYNYDNTGDAYVSSDLDNNVMPAAEPSGYVSSSDFEAGLPLIVLASVMFIGSALGLAGALIPNKKAGGVLMIVGSVPNLINLICFILLLVGGILTLMPEKNPSYPGAYPPPYYPYPPQYYPPQQQYYPPQQQYYQPPQGQYYPQQPGQYYPPQQQYYQPPPQSQQHQNQDQPPKDDGHEE